MTEPESAIVLDTKVARAAPQTSIRVGATLYRDRGDAPALEQNHAMAEASARGVRLLPVAASGADRVVEYLFRSMGAFTSTPYVYLTDDSGIGGTHMEADTDRIHVEMFAELLTRLLIADLQGQGMHEPEAS